MVSRSPGGSLPTKAHACDVRGSHVFAKCEKAVVVVTSHKNSANGKPHALMRIKCTSDSGHRLSDPNTLGAGTFSFVPAFLRDRTHHHESSKHSGSCRIVKNFCTTTS